MKKTGIGERLEIIEKAAMKGQVGGRKNVMRRIRATLDEIKVIQQTHWWCRLEKFLFRGA